MDAQELRNLQEAYMEVVINEGKVAWDDPKNPLQSGYTPKEKSEAKRKQLGVDNPETKSFEKDGPGEKEYARHGNLARVQKKMSKRGQQPKGKPHKFTDQITVATRGQLKRRRFHPPLGSDIPKEKRSSYPQSVKKEQVDLYDIILSHLLNEGYAETPEAAEAIMVNMSEEWRQSILS